MNLIEIKHLSKHFKVLNRREGLIGAVRDLVSTDFRIVKAVDDISLAIRAGEIVGYIGPNGAGKSTTIKMMTGVLKPSGGEIVVNDLVPYRHRKQNAQNMGVVFGQRTQLWWDLPVIESFKILKEIYRVGKKAFDRQMGMFCDLVNLHTLYSTPVRNLSLGQRMLCDITAAFLHTPKIVFLDEPTIGLDISIKNKIRTVIKELNGSAGTTIILTTHDLGDVEALCKRIIIIDKGRIIHDGPLRKVIEMFGAYRTLKVHIDDLSNDLRDRMKVETEKRFGTVDELVVQCTEPGWVDLSINQEKIPLRDVLGFVMNRFPIKDVRIVEISMENVVQKIYEETE